MPLLLHMCNGNRISLVKQFWILQDVDVTITIMVMVIFKVDNKSIA